MTAATAPSINNFLRAVNSLHQIELKWKKEKILGGKSLILLGSKSAKKEQKIHKLFTLGKKGRQKINLFRLLVHREK